MMRFPEFVDANVERTADDIRERYGDGFLLVNRRSLEEAAPDGLSTQLRVSTAMHRREFDETFVYPFTEIAGGDSSQVITVGRTRRSDVVLEDAAVSGLHAYFRYQSDGGEFTVSDAGSKNGTFVNDRHLERGEQRPLRGGETIVFGNAFGATFHAAHSLHTYMEFARRAL